MSFFGSLGEDEQGEDSNRPCRNPHCNSFGHVHPNCKCYGGGNGYAEGGMVAGFCDKDNEHSPECEYYKAGGSVGPKKFNFSGFHKVKEDKKTVTMAHPMGHEIRIFKAKLPALQKKQIERLPIKKMASGGDPGDDSAATAINNFVDNSQSDQNSTPAPAPEMDPALSADKFNAAVDAENKYLAGTGPGPDSSADSGSKPAGNSGPAPASVSSTEQSATSQLPSNLSLGDVYGKSLSAIGQQTKAASDLASNTAAIEAQNQAQLKQAQDKWIQSSAKMQSDISGALEDVKKGHINPSHYLENMLVGNKIATGIGLLLGGFSGGFNKTGVNPAGEWLAQQINRDVESQKADLNNKLNVYNGYLNQYKNAAVADQMTRATQMGIYASQIREAAAKAGTPMAIANGNVAAAELEQKMIPLIQNAHLTSQLAAFNGVGGQDAGRSPSSVGDQVPAAGTENQYKVALAAAQRINPDIYKDQQSKYIPGVGVASHPVAQVDSERLSRLNSLIPLIDKAVADQEHFGWTGKNISLHPVRDEATAASDYNALQVRLNELTGLNRLNDREYQNYGNQIGNIGSMNVGGPLETLKNLKLQATMDRNSMLSNMGVTPFAGALPPSGLDQRSQQNLNIFMQKNPNVPQGKAINVLREKGLISGG